MRQMCHSLSQEQDQDEKRKKGSSFQKEKENEGEKMEWGGKNWTSRALVVFLMQTTVNHEGCLQHTRSYSIHVCTSFTFYLFTGTTGTEKLGEVYYRYRYQ